MDGHLQGDRVVVEGDAKQRFYDARGYGVPAGDGKLYLSTVETAHLLLRGDLDAVYADQSRLDFPGFLQTVDNRQFGPRFLTYLDLRERGFYLSPAREPWATGTDAHIDFVVYPRGKGPQDETVEYRIRVLGERDTVDADTLGRCVLAVVDEESAITYFETSVPTVDGTVEQPPAGPIDGTLLADRVICWDHPEEIHDPAFYGQPLGTRDDTATALQLSLVEAAHLVAAGRLSLPGGYEAIVERGRAVEGDRFDRRLQVYATLRDQQVAPKTGFKFGADFRTYNAIDSLDNLGHSEQLIRVIPSGHTFHPRDLALDVRLAQGVRKTMVYAWPTNGTVEFRSIRRLTP